MKDNYFAILCWFLPYINMNQPEVYLCPLPLELPSHPSRLSQSPSLSSLSHTANSQREQIHSKVTQRAHWLSVLHLVVYIPNPLQCSCLDNPVDGGVWWAAVYGVA